MTQLVRRLLMGSFRKWHNTKLLEESENLDKHKIWGMIVTCLLLFLVSAFIFQDEVLSMSLSLVIGTILGANFEKLVTLYVNKIKAKSEIA